MLHRSDHSRVKARMQLQMIRLPYGPVLNSEATGNLVVGLT